MSIGLNDNSGEEPKIGSTRALIAMIVLAFVAFTVIIVQLYRVQIKGFDEWSEKSRGNSVQQKRIEHDRGEITDRYGRVLVTNRPSVKIELTPAFFPKTSRFLKRLGSIVELDSKKIAGVQSALERAAEEKGPPILLARDLSAEDVRALQAEQRALELPLRSIAVIEMPPPNPPGLYAAYVDPAHFPTTARVIHRLAERMELTKNEVSVLRKKVAGAQGLDIYLPIVVRRDVSAEIEERVLEDVLLGDVPGVSVDHARSRHYEFEDLAAHLLGYVNELSPQELEERREQGYKLGDAIGRRGVEKTFEESLRGLDGHEPLVVDSKGRPQTSDFAVKLQEDIGEREAPRAGDRVVLTIDLDVQRAAEQAFPGTAGAIVVMEVATGRLLALTSTPSFNPNLVTGYFDPREKKRLDENKVLRPWRFRAIQDHFAPGSTFKIVTAIAAMSKNYTTENEAISCHGAFSLGSTRFRCWKEAGHGPCNLVTALQKSCDVYFYTMGARMGLNPIAEVAHDMGFGHPTGIPLDGESPGIAPSEAWYKKHLPEGYTLGAAVNVSIGQGASTSTPIQLATVYAALANGGTVFVPQIGLRIEPTDGSPVVEIPPKVERELKYPDHVMQLVREGLRRVVNDPAGTAYSKRLQQIEVSGKTGTAQVAKLKGRNIKIETIPWHLRDHAWFASYAPANDPEIVVVVLNEHGGGGSKAAAPAAMAVIAAWHAKRQGQAALEAKKPLEIAVLADEEVPLMFGEESERWNAVD